MLPSNTNKETIAALLKKVPDPEIPVLSIMDLGIVRDIIIQQGILKEIIITPTYSGCPAMDSISKNIQWILWENGFKNFSITTVLSPAWTTDWLSEEGKQKLQQYGIAPPRINLPVQCPQCNSFHTKMINAFGSTACKALYVCEDCKEPFDYFKCH